jgi:hypothetical protein
LAPPPLQPRVAGFPLTPQSGAWVVIGRWRIHAVMRNVPKTYEKVDSVNILTKF